MLRGGSVRVRLAFAVVLVVGMGTGVAHAAGPATLMDAVKAGDHKAVEVQLAKKADVNIADADGTTALQWAVRADDLSMTGRLLQAGAKVGEKNLFGVSALFLAAENGNPA